MERKTEAGKRKKGSFKDFIQKMDVVWKAQRRAREIVKQGEHWGLKLISNLKVLYLRTCGRWTPTQSSGNFSKKNRRKKTRGNEEEGGSDPFSSLSATGGFRGEESRRSRVEGKRGGGFNILHSPPVPGHG